MPRSRSWPPTASSPHWCTSWVVCVESDDEARGGLVPWLPVRDRARLVEHSGCVVAVPHAQTEDGVVGFGEPVRGLHRPDGRRVCPSHCVVEDPSAADGRELVPTIHERDPGTRLIRDRQQSACGVPIMHPGLVHPQEIAGLERRPRLADAATDFDESVHFAHLLLDPDALHPSGPGLSPITGTKECLLDRLETSVDELIDLGSDPLALELLLAAARDG
jgi:hypothetical protein